MEIEVVDIVGYKGTGTGDFEISFSTGCHITHVGIVVSKEENRIEIIHAVQNYRKAENGRLLFFPCLKKICLHDYIKGKDESFIECVRLKSRYREKIDHVVQTANLMLEVSEELCGNLEEYNNHYFERKHLEFVHSHHFFLFNRYFDADIFCKNLTVKKENFIHIHDFFNLLTQCVSQRDRYILNLLSKENLQEFTQHPHKNNIQEALVEEIKSIVECQNFSETPAFEFNTNVGVSGLNELTDCDEMRVYLNCVILERSYRQYFWKCFFSYKQDMGVRLSCAEFIQFIFGMNGIWLVKKKNNSFVPFALFTARFFRFKYLDIKNLNVTSLLRLFKKRSVPRWSITPRDIVYSPKFYVTSLGVKRGVWGQVIRAKSFFTAKINRRGETC